MVLREGNMRSDLTCSREYKIEGRQSIHGRRILKSSPSTNGDVADNHLESKLGLTLPSAGENQKCSKSKDYRKRMDKTDKNSVSFSSVDGRMCMSEIMQAIEETPETKHLKDLLLLHLDWSQQQQELLLAKDKQILTLRSERDALKCRLERMERRMSLLRQKGSDMNKSQNFLDSPRNSPVISEQKEISRRGIKRKSSLEPQNLNKRFLSNRGDNCQIENTDIVGRGRTSRSANRRSRSFVDKNDTSLCNSSDHRNSSRDRSQSCDTEQESQNECTDDDGQPGSQKTRNFFRKKWKSDNLTASEALKNRITVKNIEFKRSDTGREDRILRTDSHSHFVRIDEEAVRNACVSPFKSQKEQLYVPSWRIHQVPTGYQLEGTENLDDEIFLKRHQKPEQEEKRRKRWDLQRLREQRLYEKLQGRSSDNQGDEIPRPFQSFHPDPDDVKYIEVADQVPVSAFGYPLPHFEQSEFELPWFDLDKKERQEKRGRPKKR